MNYFSEELAHELESRGYEIVFLESANVDSFRNSVLYMSRKIKGIFGFNGVGIDWRNNDGYRLSELFDTTYYGIYVDHPLYHSGRHHYIRHRNITFFVDKRHVEYTKKIYSMYEDVKFLPLGGTVHDEVKKISDRKKHVAIFGSYGDPDTIHKKIENEEAETNKGIIYTVIDTMIYNGLDINGALDIVLESINVNVSNEEYENITGILGKADGYVRHYIVFYDINDTAKLPKIINELLVNEKLMQKIADNGKKLCESRHL